VAAGEIHACALIEDGTVQCWGKNGNGQLGNTDSSHPDTPYATPLDVVGLSGPARLISSGSQHTCVAMMDRTIQCWGLGLDGQLGVKLAGDYVRGTPVTVSGFTGDVVALSSGHADNCALLVDGSAHCWGHNGYRQLGQPTVSWIDSPVALSFLGTTVKDIGMGWTHSCAALSDGTVSCWGNTSFAIPRLVLFGSGRAPMPAAPYCARWCKL